MNGILIVDGRIINTDALLISNGNVIVSSMNLCASDLKGLNFSVS